MAQLLILGPTYLLLGGLIIAGKERLVELREEARRLSLADPLTGLANRRALIDLLESSTASGRADDPVGLVLVDLDGFKEANTLYGHPGGDTALCAAAAPCSPRRASRTWWRGSAATSSRSSRAGSTPTGSRGWRAARSPPCARPAPS